MHNSKIFYHSCLYILFEHNEDQNGANLEVYFYSFRAGGAIIALLDPKT